MEAMIDWGNSRSALLYAAALAVLLVVALFAFMRGSRRHQTTPPMTPFAGGSYEASDVVHVPGTDGVIFVDDDRPDDVFFMRLGADRKQAARIVPVKLSTSIIDPEGITTDGTYFYVVGSQSKPRGNNLMDIARFRLDLKDLRTTEMQSIAGLRSFLATNVDELRGMQNPHYNDRDINIEGIAWDPKGARLLLGLRSPVVDGQALVVALKLRDPQGAFSFDNMEVEGRKAIRLSLNGAGIRSIEYDDVSNTFRLISGSPHDGHRMDSKLWEWSGSGESSTLRETDTLDRRLHPEGVTRVTSGNQNFLLIVFDAGGYVAKD
jgi:hypothetical protein